MATGAFQILQNSLFQAKKDLDDTNGTIKRLTGYEPKSRQAVRGGYSGRSVGSEVNQRPSSGDSGRNPPSGSLRAWSGPDSGSMGSRKREVSGEGRPRLEGRLGPADDRDPSESKRRDPFGAMSRLAGRLGPAEDSEPSENKRRDSFGTNSRLAGRLGRPGVRDPPENKRRDSFGAKSRLAGRLGPPVNWEERKRERDAELDSEGEEDGEITDKASKKNPPVQSSVVAMAAPPRPKADPNEDEKSKHRNRRMFGFLMNTLRKFKDSEETAKTSEKERRRSEIEDKLEKTREIEKEAAQQERRELFDQQKAQKMKIITIARQMEMVNSFNEWTEHDQKFMGYIRTRSKPNLFYVPKEHTPKTEELVSKTRQILQEKIDKRQKEVDSFLESANTMKSDSCKGPGDRDDPVGGGGGAEEGNKGGSENGEALD